MGEKDLSQGEVDRLLETKYEQVYRDSTQEEHEQILHNLSTIRSLNMEAQRTEIVEELNRLISHIDEMEIRVEDKGEKKHVSICGRTDNEYHDFFFLQWFEFFKQTLMSFMKNGRGYL